MSREASPITPTMNIDPRRKSTERLQGSVGSSQSSRWSYQTLAINTARSLILASIVYAAWRYGATDPMALCHLSLSLGAAVLLALSCKQTFVAGSSRLPILFFGLILVWIGYALLQQTAIAGWLTRPFHGVLDAQKHWGTDQITLLNEAVEGLNETRPLPTPGRFASVIPEETRQALVPFLLACTAAILSALLFNTRKSRLCFLWAIIANASALAFWGIIQKASGGQQILPGVENTFSSGMPFASFIYKNAGAAALLPALAGIAAILYGQSNHRRSRGSSGNYRAHSGNGLNLLETKNLALISFAILISVGLIASLSRGAWFAAVLAAIVVGLLSRISIHRREYLIVGSVAGLGMLAVITIVGIKKDIHTRAEHVSLDYVTRDQRWPQWVDGFVASVAYFPSGSGLGTYGYATLPHQSSTRSFWFREAHNQYLEVLTESGFVGVSILCMGIGWFALASWRLIRKRKDRDRSSWGLLGIALLVCGGFQSVFDFVLVIPANLILYASLVAIIGAVERKSAIDSRSRDHSTFDGQHHSALSWKGSWKYAHMPAAWCGVALVCVMCSYQASREQHLSEQSLVSTSVTRFEDRPSQETVLASIRSLSTAIDNHPHQAALYRRRVDWHLAAYRLEILRAAEQEGVAIDWASTRLENLLAVVSLQDPNNRSTLLTGLRRTPAMRSLLANALSDLSFALSLDPLTPRGHLSGSLLAPLTGMPVKPWLESTAPLVNNSEEMLYLNGLFAYQSNELDLATDQWSKSLSINHNFSKSILDLARQKLPVMRMVADLVPADSPDLYVQMVRSTKREPSESDDAPYDRMLSESIVRHLETNTSAELGRKHATIARIWQLLGDFDAAAVSWQAALKVNSRDPSYRLEYSQSLCKLGNNEEALKQAVLGQTLNPVDRRFERLTARIRQEIRRGGRR